MNKIVLCMLVSILGIVKVLSQDNSVYSKKIEYSKECIKAKKYTNLKKALTKPNEVLYLNLYIVDKTTEELFRKNFHLFVNLRKLVVESTFTKTIEFKEDLSIMRNLEYLRIMGLKCDPELKGIENLKNLKYLCLSGTWLEKFPEKVMNLTTLEILDLSINYLSILPENLNMLSNLKEFDISNNCFVNVPKQIGIMKSLIHIDFNNAENNIYFSNGQKMCLNSIDEIPVFLFEMSSLKTLSLYKVKLSIEIKTELSEKSKFKISF